RPLSEAVISTCRTLPLFLWQPIPNTVKRRFAGRTPNRWKKGSGLLPSLGLRVSRRVAPRLKRLGSDSARRGMNGFLCTRGEERTACPPWREGQAGYGCGALLMPKHRVDLPADAFGKERSIRVPPNSIDARALRKRLTDVFAVSRDAARVRLLKLGHWAD